MAKGLAPIRVPEVGLNNVGSYQVSARPFASGNIAVAHAMKVDFPMVTQYFEVINHGPGSIRVGYSQVGVSGSNYFSVPSASAGSGAGTSGVQRVKVSQIWLYCGKVAAGDGAVSGVDVVAGLTCIDRKRTAGRLGPSWSGSAGVG
jgi:hypothetical protein|tara:strand:+ start:1365 stop:1802 length:438 start_codon:yes stop_codon:yes gene_type:complete